VYSYRAATVGVMLTTLRVVALANISLPHCPAIICGYNATDH
jgi:hypothetical protein